MHDEDHHAKKKRLSIQEAFPALRDEDVVEAEARIERYVLLVYRIYESIREDPEKYERFRKRLEEERQKDKNQGLDF